MSGYGLPDFKSVKDLASGAGTSNINTRDLAPPSVMKMAIIPVGEPFNSNNILLLNTNSVTEAKSANWVKHYIPGQSDPLLQWISGSERTITFTAMVTKDLAHNPTLLNTRNEEEWQLVVKPELDQIFKTTTKVISENLSNLTNGTISNSPDRANSTHYWPRSIQPQLDFYRSLVIPRDAGTKTPPLVQLKMGTILGDADTVANQKFILLNYQMTVTEYSPELEPTKATVVFTFVEYVPKSKSSTAQVNTNPPVNEPIRDNGRLLSIERRNEA